MGLLLRNAAGWPVELDQIRCWYSPHLERIHEDAAVREPDLAQLCQIASTYPSREPFLTELTLDPPEATSGEAGVPLLDEDYLILSTIHSAKGRNGHACSCSTLLMAASHRTSRRAPPRKSRRSAGSFMSPLRGQKTPDSVLDRFENRSWPAPDLAIPPNYETRSSTFTAGQRCGKPVSPRWALRRASRWRPGTRRTAMELRRLWRR
jgi:hypothetical protein